MTWNRNLIIFHLLVFWEIEFHLNILKIVEGENNNKMQASLFSASKEINFQHHDAIVSTAECVQPFQFRHYICSQTLLDCAYATKMRFTLQLQYWRDGDTSRNRSYRCSSILKQLFFAQDILLMEMRPSLKLEVHFGIADLDFLGLVGGLELS